MSPTARTLKMLRDDGYFAQVVEYWNSFAYGPPKTLGDEVDKMYREQAEAAARLGETVDVDPEDLLRLLQKPNPGKRVDLFGVIDVVAVCPSIPGVLGVQTTSGSNVSARLAKMRHNSAVRAWLEARNRLVIHGWKKYAKKVDRKNWRVREHEVTLADLELEAPF